MSLVHTDCRWRVLAHSQRGASHLRQNVPNQDAIAHSEASDGSPSVVLAVADGHGSAKSFRSDVGARLAVDTAVEVCRTFLDSIRGVEPSVVKNQAEVRIAPRIFQEWRWRVDEHFQQNPFTEAELTRLAEQAGAAACDRAARPDQLYVAYGSTLLVAALTNEFLICFQLGDGDILAVSDSTGEVSRVIPKDETLIANETTSLCQADAVGHVRFRFQWIQDSPLEMLLLSTDGYCNSFASPDAFLKTGNDYLDALRTEGPEEVEKNLPAWLEETSQNGSGDDITVGIIYRREMPGERPQPEADSCSDERPTTDATREDEESEKMPPPIANEPPNECSADSAGWFHGLLRLLCGKGRRAAS
jgi:serine/threonine protein phosphatase PrpC